MLLHNLLASFSSFVCLSNSLAIVQCKDVRTGVICSDVVFFGTFPVLIVNEMEFLRVDKKEIFGC